MLTPGTKLGPYEIGASLGAGGMGEVYRARDIRLDRTVAVKILPSEFAADPQFRARFAREAKAIAALSHPHICTLHDVGRDADTDYLVMEFLDGETLANRLQRLRGPLPIDQALTFGAQIADALDKAHRAGIVHRDLKPANIMLTRAGTKLLDFGLAKRREPGAPFGMSAIEGTREANPDTAAGTILGTVHYMSPEQVEGREADKRSDIWALGAVLYEMATGRRPFDGASAASVIGEILKSDPAPISKSQPLTPPAFDHLVERCLAKVPDERWQDAGDVKRELSWIARMGSTTVAATAPGPPTGRFSFWVAFAAGLAIAALVAAGLTWRQRGTTEGLERMVFSVNPPDGVRFGGAFAHSPDGNRLAFVGWGTDGPPNLWIQPIDSPTAQQIPGTEDASYPFWSPQGDSVGFFANGKLKTVPVAGGTARTLASAPNARGGDWGTDGTILFIPEPNGPIYRVSDQGGPTSQVTTIRRDLRQLGHRWPKFIDTSRFVFTAQGAGESSGVYLADLGSSEVVRLVSGFSNAALANGRLLFVREGMLVAQPFDAQGRRVTGTVTEVVGPVAHVGGLGLGSWSVSSRGVLTYIAGSGATARTLIHWVDRQGKSFGPIGTGQEASQHDSYYARLSGNGRMAALATFRTATADLWLLDIARNVVARFTYDDATEINPVWSPDGARLVFSTNRAGVYNMFVKAISGSGEEKAISPSDTHQYVTDWTPDGNTLLFAGLDPNMQWDIRSVPVSGDKPPTTILSTAFNEYAARISPDGRWMAYTSDESGQPEVYVQRFPTGGDRTLISDSGGFEPQWRRDGRELFYLAPNRTLTVVPVTLSPTFSAGRPTKLFDAILDTSIGSIHSWHFAATADGQRFLVNLPNVKPSPMTIVLNWAASLR